MIQRLNFRRRHLRVIPPFAFPALDDFGKGAQPFTFGGGGEWWIGVADFDFVLDGESDTIGLNRNAGCSCCHLIPTLSHFVLLGSTDALQTPASDMRAFSSAHALHWRAAAGSKRQWRAGAKQAAAGCPPCAALPPFGNFLPPLPRPHEVYALVFSSEVQKPPC